MTNIDHASSLTLKGIHYQTGEQISIHVKNGAINTLQVIQTNDNEPLPYIGPGLVDLQINGYGGLDFNTLPIDAGLVHRITRFLWGEGVTTYFPTIITNSDELIESAMRTIARARSQDKYTDLSITGIHLEGPFISPADGPRGAHHKSFVKAPNWELFQKWQDAAEGKIKIVTLSPEWQGAVTFIEKCTESGVIVSIGHTGASPEQIREAQVAGARMSTHLGNGAHLMLPRHPNYIWEQLALDDLSACVIADGFHLPESVLKVILRVKGHRSILVSDAVFLSGMEPGEYDIHIGGKVVLTPEGKLHMANNPQLLAGSVKPLVWGIQHLVNKKITDFTDAWEMASIRPAALMGLPSKEGLKVGAPADLAVFTRSETNIDIRQTYKNGKLVFSSYNK